MIPVLKAAGVRAPVAPPRRFRRVVVDLPQQVHETLARHAAEAVPPVSTTELIVRVLTLWAEEMNVQAIRVRHLEEENRKSKEAAGAH